MKKIAILHYTFLPIIAGVELAMRDQAVLFSQKGHSVKIIAGVAENFYPGAQVEALEELNPRKPENLAMRQVLETGEMLANFEEKAKSLAEKLKKSLEGFDICIVHQAMTMHFNLLFTAALNQVVVEMKNIKFITWAHDATFLDFHYADKLGKFKEKYPWNLLTKKWANVKYVTISETRHEQMAELFNVAREEITVIGNGVDLAAFWKLSEEMKKLFYQEKLYEQDLVAVLPMRIVRRKNIEQAIKIIAELKKFAPKIKYILTGALDFQNPDIKDYFEELKKLRYGLDLDKNVIFLADYLIDGKKPDLRNIRIYELYLMADFLLVPSKIEGFGMPLAEAGAMKVPVACTDIKVFQEIGKRDVMYFKVNENPKKTAKRILKFLAKNPSSRLFRRAMHEYNLESIYNTKMTRLVSE